MEKVVEKQIHIKMPTNLHKELRIQAAIADITIQEFVVEAISAAITEAKEGKRNDTGRR